MLPPRTPDTLIRGIIDAGVAKTEPYFAFWSDVLGWGQAYAVIDLLLKLAIVALLIGIWKKP